MVNTSYFIFSVKLTQLFERKGMGFATVLGHHCHPCTVSVGASRLFQNCLRQLKVSQSVRVSGSFLEVDSS